MDVMGLIGTATGVVSLAILVAQEARHFGDMPAISSASSKYRTILENNGSADATDVLVIQRDMSEPRPDSPRWKFQRSAHTTRHGSTMPEPTMKHGSRSYTITLTVGIGR